VFFGWYVLRMSEQFAILQGLSKTLFAAVNEQNIPLQLQIVLKMFNYMLPYRMECTNLKHLKYPSREYE
jgi:hypothetical protein